MITKLIALNVMIFIGIIFGVVISWVVIKLIERDSMCLNVLATAGFVLILNIAIIGIPKIIEVIR